MADEIVGVEDMGQEISITVNIQTLMEVFLNMQLISASLIDEPFFILLNSRTADLGFLSSNAGLSSDGLKEF